MSLESRLKACHQERQNLEEFVDQALKELERELADAEQRNAALVETLERKQEYIVELEKTNWLLRQQLKTTGVSVQADYDPDRD